MTPQYSLKDDYPKPVCAKCGIETELQTATYNTRINKYVLTFWCKQHRGTSEIQDTEQKVLHTLQNQIVDMLFI